MLVIYAPKNTPFIIMTSKFIFANFHLKYYNILSCVDYFTVIAIYYVAFQSFC